MMYQLTTHYRGAELRLDFQPGASAALTINGIERDSVSSEASAVTLKLSSTAPPDYEWHDFIEAIIAYEADTIEASIHANNQQLTTRSVARTNK